MWKLENKKQRKPNSIEKIIFLIKKGLVFIGFVCFYWFGFGLVLVCIVLYVFVGLVLVFICVYWFGFWRYDFY